MRVTLKLDTVQKIAMKRNLEKNGKAQRFLVGTIRRLCRPYVPNLSGKLESTAVETPHSVEYVQPYARKQYYENSGANRSKAPFAGKQWDRRMMADRGDEVVESVAKFVGGRAK